MSSSSPKTTFTELSNPLLHPRKSSAGSGYHSPSRKSSSATPKVSEKENLDALNSEYLAFVDIFPFVDRLHEMGKLFEQDHYFFPSDDPNVAKKITQLEKILSSFTYLTKARFLKSLYRTFLKELCLAGLLVFILFNTEVYCAILLGGVIENVTSLIFKEAGRTVETPANLSRLALVLIFRVVLQSYNTYNLSVLAARIRLTITGFLYKRINSIVYSSLQDYGLEKTIKMMCTELNILDEGIAYIWTAILLPIHVLIIYLYIWEDFGKLALIMFIGLVCTLIFYVFLTSLKETSFGKKLAFAEKRILKTKEMIECIFLIKTYAWEKPLLQEIKDLRNKEDKMMENFLIMYSLAREIREQSIYVIGLIIFMVSALEEDYLSPGKVYTTIMILYFVKSWCIKFPNNARIFVKSFSDIVKEIVKILSLPMTTIYYDDETEEGRQRKSSSRLSKFSNKQSNASQSLRKSTDFELKELPKKKGVYFSEAHNQQRLYNIEDECGKFVASSTQINLDSIQETPVSPDLHPLQTPPAGTTRKRKLSWNYKKDELRRVMKEESDHPKEDGKSSDIKTPAMKKSPFPQMIKKKPAYTLKPILKTQGGKRRITTVYFNSVTAMRGENVCLKNVTVQLRPGELVSVIGVKDAGKSSFLLALLNEISITEGEIFCDGTIAYVGRESILFSGTVKSNIMFGKPPNYYLYQEVIKACELDTEFEQLANGDSTMVGDGGMNVSPQLQMKICIARALYSRSDIYLFDEPFSTMDISIARHIFEIALKGNLLKSKVVLLVTDNPSFVRESNRVLLFKDHHIEADGTPEEILRSNKYYLSQVFNMDELIEEPEIYNPYQLKENLQFERASRYKTMEPNVEDIQLSWESYSIYIGSNSWRFFVFIVLLFVLQNIIFMNYIRMLGHWAILQSEEYVNHTKEQFDNEIYIEMGIYYIVSLFIIGYLKRILTAKYFIQANTRLHNEMAAKITRVPITFFEKTSGDSILKSFSEHLDSLDREAWMTLHDLFSTLSGILCLAVVVSYMYPFLILAIVIAFSVLGIALKIFFNPIQQAETFEIQKRKMISLQISATIKGLLVVKCLRQSEEFITNLMNLLYQNIRCFAFQERMTRQFRFMTNMVLCCLLLLGALFFVKLGWTELTNIDLIGFILFMLLKIFNKGSHLMHQGRKIYNDLHNLGSIIKYTKLPEEPCRDQLNMDPKLKNIGWPTQGHIQFENVVLRYGNETKYVSTVINLEILPGSKVALIGATEFDKMCFIRNILRMTKKDPKDCSKIKIDDVDISKVGLDLLRKSVCMIPQNAIILSGSIRQNLDPFNDYSEEQIWSALEEVKLKSYVESLPKKLDTEVGIPTKILSPGQKQLLHLARGILWKSKVMMIDELTAHTDIEIDSFIQQKIQEKFEDCTVITIAHKLTTIANYDRIIVLDKGRIIEDGIPYLLLVGKEGDKEITRSGFFAAMVQHTGKATARKIVDMAYNKYIQLRESS